MIILKLVGPSRANVQNAPVVEKNQENSMYLELIEDGSSRTHVKYHIPKRAWILSKNEWLSMNLSSLNYERESENVVIYRSSFWI